MIKKVLPIAILFAIIGGYWVFRNRQPSMQQLPDANVLLITIDTIRPDHLSCYGAETPTPHIDSIARTGILFENAFAQVPLTFPSHTSILTGLYPVNHGIRNNGLEILQKREANISRTFRAGGYRTGAVVASFVLDRKFGLADDFEIYDDRMERKPGITTQFEVERPGNEVQAAAIQILEQFRGKKWFLWLHFYDPHTPYEHGGYSGEVQFVDAQIGKIFDWLKSQGLDRNLIVALLGDHGESLGEHGESTHGFFVYNSTLRIPFMLSYPGAKRKTIRAAVASVDLFPSLLELTGLKDHQQRDGESLWKIIAGQQRRTDIYFESHYPELLGWNGLQGIFRSNWKLIATTRSELYDWHSDREEKANLYSTEESTSRSLKKALQNFQSSENTANTAPDAETLEKLRSLGYISTGSTTGKREADPKDKIAVWAEYEEAALLKLAGKEKESREKLKEIAAREPQNFFFRIALATDYREAKEYSKAIEELRAAIELEPSNASTYYELAVAYKNARNYPEAFQAIQAAIALDPDRSEFHNIHGMLLVETGKSAEAENKFAQVLKIDPNNAVAWNNLGNALREMNRLQEAEHAYKKSIELSPSYAYPYNGLATIMVRQNQTRQALPYMEKALELDPEFVEVYLNLGIAYHTLGEPEKAKTLYRTFLKIAPDWMAQDKENARLLLSQIPS